MSPTMKLIMTVAAGVVLGGMVLGLGVFGAAEVTAHAHKLRQAAHDQDEWHDTFTKGKILDPSCNITDAQLVKFRNHMPEDVTPEERRCNDTIVIVLQDEYQRNAWAKANFWAWWPW